uniref:(northern house mosquito) hypothetical protein n=1 Tax=Culex pipiens TaxID=7175 RepID=A0A8D8BJJ1_CULPI
MFLCTIRTVEASRLCSLVLALTPRKLNQTARMKLRAKKRNVQDLFRLFERMRKKRAKIPRHFRRTRDQQRPLQRLPLRQQRDVHGRHRRNQSPPVGYRSFPIRTWTLMPAIASERDRLVTSSSAKFHKRSRSSTSSRSASRPSSPRECCSTRQTLVIPTLLLCTCVMARCSTRSTVDRAQQTSARNGVTTTTNGTRCSSRATTTRVNLWSTARMKCTENPLEIPEPCRFRHRSSSVEFPVGSTTKMWRSI